MRGSIPGVALVFILAGCANAPNVAVMHAPGSSNLVSANQVRLINTNSSNTTLSVSYSF
jgi:hypothetical protein